MASKPVSIYLPDDLLAAIDARAAAEGRSRSQWLARFLIAQGVTADQDSESASAGS